jgi:hypothetical protein
MAVQMFYKFTSACVALAILQVRTKELIPEQLIVRHLLQIFSQNRFGRGSQAAQPIFFSETGQLVI